MQAELRWQWLYRRYLFREWCDKRAMWIAWHLPRSVVRWAMIRVMAHGTTGRYNHIDPSTLHWSEALQYWELSNERV